MNRKNFITINKGFVCRKCRRRVRKHSAGSCRNHCPFCLFSLHLDSSVPGDREEKCEGLMAPICAEADRRKTAVITHHCQKCGKKNRNRVAPDDNWELVCQLSRIPH